jgi:hypothetical protein
MSEMLAKEREVTLLDLLDRILYKGVIIHGDITISVADVDLVYLGLKVLLTSVERMEEMRMAQLPSQGSHLAQGVEVTGR